MKKILIIPSDGEAEYSRMLELELKKRGADITYDRGEAQKCFAVITVLGEATPEAVEKLCGAVYSDETPMICCARSRSGVMPSGTVFFERPMDVERFCGFVEIITEGGRAPAQKEKALNGDLVIDRKARLVICRGERIDLTEKELKLLLYLDLHRGEPITREDAIRDVWNFGYTGDTNLVDVYIRYLRRKLDERFDAKFIVTVRGKGYMLRR